MADESFDRLLRRRLRADTAPGTCPEASDLAAYADASLDDDERDVIQAHAASCARCSAELALIAAAAGTSSSPSAAEAQGFRLYWRWAVPLATAVLVFVLWTETDRRDRPSEAVPSAARAPSGRPETDTGPLDLHGLGKDTSEPAFAGRQQNAASSRPGATAAPAQGPPAPRKATREEARARSQESRAPKEEQRADGSAVPPEDLAQAPQSEHLEDVRTFRAGEARDSLAAPARSDEPARREAPAAAPAPPAPAAPAPSEAAKLLERAESEPMKAASAAGSRTLVISAGASPDVRIRSVDGRIERTTDGGRTWRLERETLPGAIHAGVCPTLEACWLGGDRGLVLRREPSGTWADASIPADAAVTAVHAADAATAVASLADGRRFRTVDGGRRWSPLP